MTRRGRIHERWASRVGIERMSVVFEANADIHFMPRRSQRCG
jgi:hypothetical protein